MSLTSDRSSRHCFLWAVERPVTKKNRYSPEFYLDKEPHCLEFSLKDETYYIKLMYKGIATAYTYCHITIHVEDRSRCTLPLSNHKLINNEFGGRKIFCVWRSEILEAVPDFLTDGLMRFLVTFDYHEYCNFTLEPPISKEDKSVQKEEVPINKEDKSVQKEEEKSIHKEDKSAQTPSCFSSDPCLEDLSTNLSNLLEKNSRPDVVLACGDLVLRAHKNVLCSRSRVFSAMLRNDMAEGLTGQVQIPDMDSGIFEAFIRYLHTGKLSGLTEDNAKRLYEAADKYAVVALQKRCAGFLLEVLSPENACEMLAVADAHSDQGLKESVLVYILQEEIPLLEDQWSPFCSRHPKLAVEVLNRFCKKQKNA